MPSFGVSFSVPYAEYLGVDPRECLSDALADLGVKRLRLMSYWNRIEATRSAYDFDELDWQIGMAETQGAEVTLCLGLRQPRWPESHWPDWAKELEDSDWQAALMDFVEAVVERYKGHDCIRSYQLENEAMLRKFGKDGNFDRNRLKSEFKLVKSLDPKRPVIMSTSDSWGVPVFGPRPDSYAFSIYRYFYDKGGYKHSSRPPIFYTLRAGLIRICTWRPVFIHELQAEPWGPKGMIDMSVEEQFKSVNPQRVKEAVAFARKTKLKPIDVWGLEWWYWLKQQQGNEEVWNYMRSVYKNS